MKKIVMIDDGIPQYLALKFRNFKIHHLLVEKQEIYCKKYGRIGRMTHGGICFLELANRLKEYNVELYSINVIPVSERRGDITNLICALQWCISNDVSLINISIGTTNYFDFVLLEPLLKKIYQQGKIVIAAHSNNYVFSYPANSPYAIGVRFDNSNSLKGNSYYLVDNKITNEEVISSKEEITYIKQYVNVEDECNSFAVPILSAKIYFLLSQSNISRGKILSYLRKNSVDYLEMWNLRQRYIVDKNHAVPLVMIKLKKGDKIVAELLDLFALEGYCVFTLESSTTKKDIRYINFFSIFKDCQKSFRNTISFIQHYSNADLILIKSDEKYDDELYNEELVDLTITDKRNKCTNIIFVDEETETTVIMEKVLQILL